MINQSNFWTTKLFKRNTENWLTLDDYNWENTDMDFAAVVGGWWMVKPFLLPTQIMFMLDSVVVE